MSTILRGSDNFESDDVQQLETYVNNKPTGFKNLIINGGFDVWQRGSGPFTGYNYGPDRWVCANGTHNSSATSSVIGKRMNHITNTTAGGGLLFQAIELNLAGYNAPFTAGKTFTISVYYSSTTKIKPSLIFRDGVVGNNPVEIFTTTEYKGGSGSNQVVSWTFAVSATALLSNTCASLAIIGESVATNCYVYNVQLEEGSVATPFEQRPYGLELSLCQRYYQKVYSLAGYSVASTSVARMSANLPVNMRVTPSVSLVGTILVICGNNGTNPTLTGITLSACTSTVIQLDFSCTSYAVTTPGQVASFLTSSGYISASAEL